MRRELHVTLEEETKGSKLPVTDLSKDDSTRPLDSIVSANGCLAGKLTSTCARRG